MNLVTEAKHVLFAKLQWQCPCDESEKEILSGNLASFLVVKHTSSMVTPPVSETVDETPSPVQRPTEARRRIIYVWDRLCKHFESNS